MHEIWPGRRAHKVKYENINNSDLHVCVTCFLLPKKGRVAEVNRNENMAKPDNIILENVKYFMDTYKTNYTFHKLTHLFIQIFYQGAHSTFTWSPMGPYRHKNMIQLHV